MSATLVLAAGVTLSLACGQDDPFEPLRRKAAAVEKGKKTVESASSLHALYPKARSSIENYLGEDSTWVAEVGLHGRYILSMAVPIRLDDNHENIVWSGEPSYTLVEVDRIEVDESGRAKVHFRSKSQLRFGPKLWMTLAEKRGDLTALGIAVRTTEPIQEFEKYCLSLPVQIAPPSKQ